MKTLCVIPARGGSKGVPGKNIKPLNGKPLICYSIDVARKILNDIDICVSTDDDEIISVVESYGLKVHFKRPENLSDDKAGMNEVLMHALDYYKQQGLSYDNLILLQPTSPFRKEEQLRDILEMYNPNIDMVVSVAESHQSPYFTLFEETDKGFLKKSKDGYYQTRQQAPKVFYYNGSVYLINIDSLKEKSIHSFDKIVKYCMTDVYSVDIDSPLDWAICETIIKQGYIII